MPVILLAEDDPLQRRSLRRMLERELQLEVVEAENGAEALDKLKAEPTALALVDIGMPVMDGMSLLKTGHELFPNLPFIMLTASEQVEDAVQAMRLGAVDFISKPPVPARLIASVRNAMVMQRLRDEVGRLQRGKPNYFTFEDMLEVSPSLQEAANLGRKAAASEIPVLITGESGVGKEVFAHAIHLAGPRADKPFVSVNCGALPEQLVESILFGHEKGSFTGATAKSIGKCREADGGVLFLDEVGELKPDAQVKLLRLLQEGEIEPVGAGRPVKVNIRILSATNRSLEQMVAQGRFREDLYYRLHGLPLHIPPLRERRKDLPILAQHLLEQASLTNAAPPVRLAPEAEHWLMSYHWPGNVREMQHLLSRAALLAENGCIEMRDLARWAREGAASRAPMADHGPAPASVRLERADGQFKTLEALEQEIIEAALVRYGAHIGRAAAALGIGQSTLYKRMRRPSARS